MVHWRIKSQANEDARQQFLDGYVPQILRARADDPRPEAAPERATARGSTPSPTGTSCMAVVTGHGPASAERLAFRRLSRAEVDWVSSRSCSRRRRDARPRLRGLPAGAQGPAASSTPARSPRPTSAFAEIYAREFYGRRSESEALWLVPRDGGARDRGVPGRVRHEATGASTATRSRRGCAKRASARERSTRHRERPMSERTDLLLALADDELDPRLAQLGVDGDRAVPRGGRRVLVDRAERDRARARAVRARRRRARDDRRRARVRPQAGRSTAARRSSSCAASSGHGRSRDTGSTRRRTRSGSRR